MSGYTALTNTHDLHQALMRKDEVIDALRAENERLLDAVEQLWAECSVAQVKEIVRERPELADLARHAHHRMWHEERGHGGDA